MTRAIDMTGQRIENWLVLSRAENSRDGKLQFLCRCDCGKEKVIVGKHLRQVMYLGCECEKSIPAIAYPEWNSYHGARARCNSPCTTHFERYGGRGIEFRFKDFWDFYATVGPKPTRKHTIERINNDGHYEPGNVCWATRAEQAGNRSDYRKSHCVHGHEYTETNTFINAAGRRECRICIRARKERNRVSVMNRKVTNSLKENQLHA